VARLDRLATEALVEALDTPNGTVRDLVQAMLGWRSDPSAAAPLAALASTADDAAVRTQALCALDRLGAVDEATLRRAFADAHPGVRRQAVRIAGVRNTGWLAGFALCTDPDPGVRQEIAAALGRIDGGAAARALAGMLADAGDPWLVGTILTSAPRHLDALLAADTAAPSPTPFTRPLLDTAIARGEWRSVGRLVDRIAAATDPRAALDWLAALVDALDARPDAFVAFRAAFGGERLAASFAAARRIAGDESAALDLRRRALSLLGAEPGDVDLLAALCAPHHPVPLQEAAVARLCRIPDRRVPGFLLDRVKGLGPVARTAVVDGLLDRAGGAGDLLDWLAAHPGAVSVDPARRERLRGIDGGRLRERVASVLGAAADADRERVVARYRTLVDGRGDAGRGAAVFARACATCHRWRDVGTAIGPDFDTLTDRSIDGWLVALFDPARAVLDRYVPYVLEATDRRSVYGIVVAETAASVTIRDLGGNDHRFARTAIGGLRRAGGSLMPNGLEHELSPDAVDDLLAWIHGGFAAPPPKSVPGNAPKSVVADADGTPRLEASVCEIRGGDLTFEPEHRNLGFWHGEQDAATWTVITERDDEFRVLLVQACPDAQAGKTFVLGGNGVELRGAVRPTGGWDRYVEVEVGRLRLVGGTHRLTFRSVGTFSGALVDLRAIHLVPVR
jgi:putative heme-binding domain-containing protein